MLNLARIFNEPPEQKLPESRIQSTDLESRVWRYLNTEYGREQMACCADPVLVWEGSSAVCQACGECSDGDSQAKLGPPVAEDPPNRFAVALPEGYPQYLEGDIRAMQARVQCSPSRSWQAAASYVASSRRGLGRTRLEVRRAWRVSGTSFSRHLSSLQTHSNDSVSVDDLIRKYIGKLQMEPSLARDVLLATREYGAAMDAVAHRRPHAVAAALLFLVGDGQITATVLQERCGVSRRMTVEIAGILRATHDKDMAGTV